MNGFEIDCELNYEVLDPTVFVFNIEAARIPGQRLVREHLSTLPAIALDRYTNSVGNRFTRLAALPGPPQRTIHGDRHRRGNAATNGSQRNVGRRSSCRGHAVSAGQPLLRIRYAISPRGSVFWRAEFQL